MSSKNKPIKILPNSNEKIPTTLLYSLGLVVLAASVFLFHKYQNNKNLAESSDMFYKLLENDVQYKNILLKQNNIYSQMTKIHLSLNNDPEFKGYLKDFWSEGLALFPGFFMSQLLVVELLRRPNPVDNTELYYLTRARNPATSPWESMVRWIKLTVNEENTKGKYTNAYFIDKTEAEIDELIESEFRCVGF